MPTEPQDNLSRGTGGSPVRGNEKAHGRAAHATLEIRQGAYLPHWTLTTGGIYAVTYRLADSLPKTVVERLLRERTELEREATLRDGELTKAEERRLAHLHSKKIESYLDAGNGSCWLREPNIAQIVFNNWSHFAGDRSCMHAWCVMPNHVHVLVEPVSEFHLTEIVHSWKSFTAKAANKLLHRNGDFWQPEYYDHLIRDEADYAHAVWYTEQNPAQAGLKGWRWVSRGTGVPPVEPLEHGRDARATE